MSKLQSPPPVAENVENSEIDYVIYFGHVARVNDGDVLSGTDWYWADKNIYGNTRMRSVRAAQRFASFDEAEKNIEEYFDRLKGKNIFGNPVVYAVVIQRNYFSSDRAMPTGNRREFWLDTQSGESAEKETVKAPELMPAGTEV
jgi:hypothetical protein